MALLALKIKIEDTNNPTNPSITKVFRFPINASVREVLNDIIAKTEKGGRDYGLFQPADPKNLHPARWLKDDRTLAYYDLKNEEILEYKKRHRNLRIQMVDGTVKTIMIDDSATVGENLTTICEKIGLPNPEEFSLQRPENEVWLKPGLSLPEQGVVDAKEVLLLKKRYFASDDKVDTSDPIQLHLLYAQCLDAVLKGNLYVTEEEAINLASYEMQDVFGDHDPNKHVKGFLKLEDFLPKYLIKDKKRAEKCELAIYQAHKKLVGMNKINAKFRYVQMCRALKSYGTTFYQVDLLVEKGKKAEKVPYLLGISRNQIIVMDAEKEAKREEFNITWLRRWSASDTELLLDFGDYTKTYYKFATKEAEDISQLIGGYIDIILKRQKDSVKKVEEEDEGEVAAVEDVSIVRGRALEGQTGLISPSAGDSVRAQTAAVAVLQSQNFGKVAPQGQYVQQSELGSAARAIHILADEMKPAGFEGVNNQWKTEMLDQSGVLLNYINSFVAELGKGDAKAAEALAKPIVYHFSQLSKSIKAMPVGEETKDLYEGAKRVAEDLQKLLAMADQGKLDNDAAAAALERLKDFNKLVASEALLDDPAFQLLLQSANAVSATTDDLNNQLEQALARLPPQQRARLLDVAKKSAAQAQAILARIKDLGPAVGSEEERRRLLEQAKNLANMIAILSRELQAQGVQSPAVVDRLNNIQNALRQLENVLEMAKPSQTEVLPPDVAQMAIDLSLTCDALNSQQYDPAEIVAVSQAIERTAKQLGKMATAAAEHLDEDAKKLVLKAVAETLAAAAQIVPKAKIYSEDPNDPNKFRDLVNASKQLQEYLQGLLGALGRDAAESNLRDAARRCAAALAKLVTSSQNARNAMPAGYQNPELDEAIRDVSDEIQRLIASLRRAEVTNDPEAMSEFSEEANKAVTRGYRLLAAARSTVPDVRDPKLKSNLKTSVNDADRAVQTLWAANRNAVRSNLLAEMQNSLDLLASQSNELDGALVAVQSGKEIDLHGVTRPSDFQTAMSDTLKSISESIRDIVQSSTTNPDGMIPAINKLTALLNNMTALSKFAAAQTTKIPAKLEILGAAKQAVKQCDAIVRMAQIIWTNPKETASKLPSLAKAAKDLAAALKSLFENCQNQQKSEAARAFEEASKQIQTAMQKTFARPPPPNPKGTVSPRSDLSQQRLNDALKNMKIALKNLLDKTDNPAEIIEAARLFADALIKLLGAVSEASGTYSSEQQQKELLNAAKNVAQQSVEMLDKAATGMKNNDPKFQSEVLTMSKNLNRLIQNLIAVAAGITEAGASRVDEALTQIEAAASDLQGAILNAKVGVLEDQQADTDKQMTIQQKQKDLLALAKALEAQANKLMAAQNLDDVANEAKTTAEILPRFVKQCRANAAASFDRQFQSNLLLKGKGVVENLSFLIEAAKRASVKPTPENKNEVVKQGGDTLKATADFIDFLVKNEPAGLKECDEALGIIKSAIDTFDKAPIPQQQQLPTYAQQQEIINKSTRELFATMSKVMSNVKQPQEIKGSIVEAARNVSTLLGATKLAAHVTSNKTAKQDLQTHGRKVAITVGNSIFAVKNYLSDPHNPAKEVNPTVMLETVTNVISALLQALREGAVAERACEIAAEKIHNSVTDLDAAAFFAVAGQLDAITSEKDISRSRATKGTQSLETSLNELLTLLKRLEEAAQNVVTSAKGSLYELGDAAKKLSELYANLVTDTKVAASILPDSESQQKLLYATKPVGQQSQQLVLNARKFNDAPNDANLQQQLTGTHRELQQSIQKLAQVVKTAADEAARGIRELENSKQAIRQLIALLGDTSKPGKQNVTASDVIISAKSVSDAAGKVSGSITSPQEEFIQALKFLVETNRELVHNVKGTPALCNQPNVVQQVTFATKVVLEASLKELDALAPKFQAQGLTGDVQKQIADAASDVTDKVFKLISAAEALPGGKQAKELIDTADTSALEDLAERELLNAARIIKDAAEFLMQARPKREKKERVPGMELEEGDITDAILDSAQAITGATGVLVEAATVVQKELVARGKANKNANPYRRDPTWAQGLVSAAQAVGSSVKLLVEKANLVCQGQAGEEHLIAAARAVASATAQLVTASSVKVDPGSVSHAKLTKAAKAVAEATSHLVNAAKAVEAKRNEPQAAADVSSDDSFTIDRIKELECLAKVAKLEKELERARQELSEIRKGRYQKSQQPKRK
jgi:talin